MKIQNEKDKFFVNYKLKFTQERVSKYRQKRVGEETDQ